MKRLKLLLLIIIALFFASCHKYNGPDEVPQKYIDIFPYHLGQKLVFSSSNETISMEIVGYNEVMDNACYGSSWEAHIEITFESEYFNGNRQSGILKVSNEHDYGNLMFYHYYGENVSFKEDTIIIYDYQSNECAKIVKYKGIIEFEDNGVTWTLIE
ncbi:MAG: hypothetical protein MJ069_04230 [Salinivirgaceae bacterium]|nr:hypothetical protein [Salinivirgaceae bacterium]